MYMYSGANERNQAGFTRMRSKSLVVLVTYTGNEDGQRINQMMFKSEKLDPHIDKSPWLLEGNMPALERPLWISRIQTLPIGSTIFCCSKLCKCNAMANRGIIKKCTTFRWYQDIPTALFGHQMTLYNHLEKKVLGNIRYPFSPTSLLTWSW